MISQRIHQQSLLGDILGQTVVREALLQAVSQHDIVLKELRALREELHVDRAPFSEQSLEDMRYPKSKHASDDRKQPRTPLKKINLNSGEMYVFLECLARNENKELIKAHNNLRSSRGGAVEVAPYYFNTKIMELNTLDIVMRHGHVSSYESVLMLYYTLGAEKTRMAMQNHSNYYVDHVARLLHDVLIGAKLEGVEYSYVALCILWFDFDMERLRRILPKMRLKDATLGQVVEIVNGFLMSM